MAMDMAYSYQPIILLGAGRSGTKIVRDVLGTHSAIDQVPFDVNYIWRIGQKQDQDDLLLPNMLTEPNKRLIIKQFNKFTSDAPILLEKTVSNSLRIPYVLEVFPNAKFVHLVRDGRDVSESVLRQWGEVREISYLFKKLKTFPLVPAFSYLIDYGINWIKFALTNKGQDKYIWGVKYPGYREDLKTLSVLEVCAKQWKYCTDQCSSDLAKLPSEKQIEIKYEELMQQPEKVIQKLAKFLTVDVNGFDYSNLNTKNIGKYKAAFSKDQLDQILPILRPGLIKFNYI